MTTISKVIPSGRAGSSAVEPYTCTDYFFLKIANVR